MITLRQLRYLAALARHRHFGRAAEDCSVTQPALSMQIRDLEREIGAALVERRPDGIVLTDIGIDVAQRAERILAATRDLVDFARHRDLLSGRLRLGIIPTLAPYVLPRVLPRLQVLHPQLRLEVRETQTKLLLEELTAGTLDCVMLALPVDGTDVAPSHGRRRRPEPAHSAGGGPLPARPGAGLLRHQPARSAGRPRCHITGNGHADGGKRLRRHAGAGSGGRR
jgi:DNA-binding transcriptional LysR family regulator